MRFTETKLSGAFIVDIERHADSRGFFARSFCQQEFAEHGLNPFIAQANVAFNKLRGTMRGMHFQFPPAAETKLVRVTRGAILDVIVDLRPESATFLQHVAVELTAENHRCIYVPERFAHGFQVLKDNTETGYEMGAFYAPEFESGLPCSDPALGVPWPLPVAEISSKDASWCPFEDVQNEIIRRMSLIIASR